MDLNQLKTLLGNDKNMVQRFIEIFKAQTPQQLSQLSVAIQNKDWDQISILAHSIKSQVNYLGLKKIAEIAFSIEDRAEKKENLEFIEASFSDLKVKLNKVLELLN